MEAFTLHAEPSRTEPDRAWPSVFTGRCLFLLASRRPIVLRSRFNFLRLKCVFFYFTMNANTLDCEVLINAVHLRPAFWEQSDKNDQNWDLKLKLWEEVAAECDSFRKQKCYYLIYWLQFSHVMCWGNNTKVIYHSLSFIRHSAWPSHIISSLSHVRLHCYNQCVFRQSTHITIEIDSECISYPSCPQIWSVIRSCDLTFMFINTGTEWIFLVL